MPETPTKIQPTADVSREPSKKEKLKSALFISLSSSVAVYVGMLILDQLFGLFYGIFYGALVCPVAFVVALAIVWKVKTKPSLDRLTRILVLIVLALGPIVSLTLLAMGVTLDFGSSLT
jgi:hypothetical protein